MSALDVAVRAQTLNLLKRLQDQFQLTYAFISHDMSVVQYMADEVVVMLLGHVVERASRTQFFKAPQHPYSQALLASVPSVRNAHGDNPGVSSIFGTGTVLQVGSFNVK